MNQPISPPFGKQDIRVSKRRKRILYIDDNEDSAEMMPLLLGLAGYKVTAVPSVQANVEIATGGDFDLILLENWLAERSGVELCKAIRAFDTDIPIVFFTTDTREKDREKALAAGANAYLVKPHGLSNIVKTITQLTDNHPAMA
jgi:two-component system OmpR family response regulator